ncbi:hypothetical protein jhhlp_002596 [Lomentospora prolificans]|uniref:Methyltransferase domain-containing protein n=1 Tax=Lomentospora prolificans TaxID=41688 RepID=A0A2N3NEI1_9PEZI|nr:hypothetical protein jhhlp_002596 [Lomentospora prolificans]
MIPEKPLPYSDEFASPEDYISALLDFGTTSDLFQILCGGVHILDFFTTDPGLFATVFDQEWRDFLLKCDIMDFLDLLMRDDLDVGDLTKSGARPPPALVAYIAQIRRLSLDRSFTPKKQKLPVLPRKVALGMKTKKVHEVTNFADYIDRLVDDVCAECHDGPITHLVDFGSGQNYLGRTLACPPYNRRVVAVEGREHNIAGAKSLDQLAGIAKKPEVLRNKKLYQHLVDSQTPKEQLSAKAQRRLAKGLDVPVNSVADLRPREEIGREASYKFEEGKGSIQYIVGRLENGDLSHIVSKIETIKPDGRKSGDQAGREEEEQRLMAISIHSCGNLSNFGIRSLVLNPTIRAVAIVGCCYNLLTERLGPPTYNYPYMRPSLQPVNGRVARESAKYDPEGFPMSNTFVNHGGDGVRFNITARMMACQAPQNWTKDDSDEFFTRHYFRAVLQKIFLDRGVVNKVHHNGEPITTSGGGPEGPFDMSTKPVILGSLRKGSYDSFKKYVRAAVLKLTTNTGYKRYAEVMKERMANMTDEEIEHYEKLYEPRKKEIAVVWSLMAFSAGVVEAMIVTDRWLFLKEHSDLVAHCWVESVFDYKQSPRNLVIVGIKK